MTEQELREKISEWECERCYSRYATEPKCMIGHDLGKCPGYYNYADQILALIKQANYVRLSDVVETIRNCGDYKIMFKLVLGGYRNGCYNSDYEQLIEDLKARLAR